MKDETLSALLDGECSPAELDQALESMERDPALRARFRRMCLAHEVRQGVRVRRIPTDFADRVLAALPERPDGTPERAAERAPGLNVVPLRPKAPFAWRPAAGLAAAATLGAVAVLVLRPEPAPTTVTVVPAPPALAVAPDAAEAALAQRVSRLDDEKQRQLRNYLMTYSQSRAQQGMGGTLGYARYAAHTDAADTADTGQIPDAQR